MPKVTIKSITGDNFENNINEMTIVEVDGKEIGRGWYGGEVEDNYRFRHYGWVEILLKRLAESLGAEIDKQLIEGEEAEKYFE